MTMKKKLNKSLTVQCHEDFVPESLKNHDEIKYVVALDFVLSNEDEDKGNKAKS